MKECIHISQGFKICKCSFHYSKSQELTTWRFTSILHLAMLLSIIFILKWVLIHIMLADMQKKKRFLKKPAHSSHFSHTSNFWCCSPAANILLFPLLCFFLYRDDMKPVSVVVTDNSSEIILMFHPWWRSILGSPQGKSRWNERLHYPKQYRCSNPK